MGGRRWRCWCRPAKRGGSFGGRGLCAKRRDAFIDESGVGRRGMGRREGRDNSVGPRRSVSRQDRCRVEKRMLWREVEVETCDQASTVEVPGISMARDVNHMTQPKTGHEAIVVSGQQVVFLDSPRPSRIWKTSSLGHPRSRSVQNHGRARRPANTTKRSIAPSPAVVVNTASSPRCTPAGLFGCGDDLARGENLDGTRGRRKCLAPSRPCLAPSRQIGLFPN